MARQVETVEVTASQWPGRSAAVRRRLRLGPRSRPVIRRPLRSHVRSGTADMNIVEKGVDKAVDKGRALAEWHDMMPGQQQAAWAELERGLRGCVTVMSWVRRTGCRGPSALVADDLELAEEWAHADPLAGTPGIDIAAGRARLAGECLTTATVAAALDSGDASAVPLLRDYVFYAGAWWVPASSGWVKVPRPGSVGESFPSSPQISGTASPAAGSSGDPWQG
jgi:hypothetical protein